MVNGVAVDIFTQMVMGTPVTLNLDTDITDVTIGTVA